MTAGPATDPDEDPGLANERTGLAWQRSALALAGNAALVLRAGIELGPLLVGIAASALLFAGSVRAWIHGGRLYRRRAAHRPEHQARSLRRLTLLTLGTAAAALTLTLWP